MPKVIKQTARPIRRQATVVSRITSSYDDSGVKLTVYGRGKTGKTRFACTAPKPLLLIGTEDGRKSIKGTKGVEFVMLQRSEEITDLATLCSEGKYKSVVVDTAGGVQDLILKEVLGIDEVPIEKGWGTANRESWQCCGQQTKERLRELLFLSQHGVHVVIIAHERNFDFEEESNSLIMPTVGPALTPGVTGWLNGACDYICQTFIREQVGIKQVTIGKKTMTQEVKTNKVEYCLRTGPHPVYMTGFRVSVGTSLPDIVVDPTFDKLSKLF